MKCEKILSLPDSAVIEKGDPEKEISKVFCCDLLSIAMSKAPAGSVWVTVMGNKNTVAVASLVDVSCIVLAEGVAPGEGMQEAAAENGITLLTTNLPEFDIALQIHEAL